MKTTRHANGTYVVLSGEIGPTGGALHSPFLKNAHFQESQSEHVANKCVSADDSCMTNGEDFDEVRLDEIGRWSEVKLSIIREYAKSYTQILSKQPGLRHYYLDGFAGAGFHVRKQTGELVSGSPLNVTAVDPPFAEYHLVELNEKKAAFLRKQFGTNPRVTVHEGDCNKILLDDLLPRIQYKLYRRAFCLLDPYGLHLDWQVIKLAGQLGTVDLLLHFPMMDMNLNALFHDPTKVRPDQALRMTRFWGDDSWQKASRAEETTLFGPQEVKAGNEAIVTAFCDRLKAVAGFKNVPVPLPMRNSSNAIVYYLVFASANDTASKIITSIFNKYRSPR